MARDTELVYRMRAGASMAPVRELLAKLGEPEPHFLLSCAWTAEEPGSGEIVALSQVQSVPIVEPFRMLTDRYDGGAVLKRLFDETHEYILSTACPRVLMHTQHAAMRRMLTRIEGVHAILDQFFDWRRP